MAEHPTTPEIHRAIRERQRAGESLDALIAEAIERVKAMFPDELKAMLDRQRESWVHGEMALGEEDRRRTGRAIT